MSELLRQLWPQPFAAHPFRPLSQICAAWAEEFEQEYAAAGAVGRIDPGLAVAGIALFRALPGTAQDQVLLRTTCTVTTSSPLSGHHGWSSIPAHR